MDQKKCPTIILCILFALWIFIVPAVAGILLYIRNIKIDKEKENEINYTSQKIEELKQLRQQCQTEYDEILNNKESMLGQMKQEAIDKVENDLSSKKKEIEDLKLNADNIRKQIYDLSNDLTMQDFGIYKPTYKFANSDLYKESLKNVRDKEKLLIRQNEACTGNTDWTVNGNKAQGRKMVKDTQKLLLRAFNVECDDIINNVRISNFDKSKERIYKTSDQISKLGSVMNISINTQYINLKIEELCLALDFEQKKQEEKERIKEERERQREEAKAQKEIEAARKKLEKEQAHYKNALLALQEQLEKSPEDSNLLLKKRELELNIEDTQKAIKDVDYREANKRAGYVYIISNIGAFGENVYKIGMTRRLDPMDRVNELGDASVPFNFDVHALIFTEDAPKLESALHSAFENNKINKINQRREFFKVSLEEIKQVVRNNFDKTVEWNDIPEADQYRQSIIMDKK